MGEIRRRCLLYSSAEENRKDHKRKSLSPNAWVTGKSQEQRKLKDWLHTRAGEENKNKEKTQKNKKENSEEKGTTTYKHNGFQPCGNRWRNEPSFIAKLMSESKAGCAAAVRKQINQQGQRKSLRTTTNFHKTKKQ